jgi:hypothetical protein
MRSVAREIPNSKCRERAKELWTPVGGREKSGTAREAGAKLLNNKFTKLLGVLPFCCSLSRVEVMRTNQGAQDLDWLITKPHTKRGLAFGRVLCMNVRKGLQGESSVLLLAPVLIRW